MNLQINALQANALVLALSFGLAYPALAQSTSPSPSASTSCPPEHAAMGHCTPPAQPGASRCTPEHAAMGHCTLPAEPASSACTPEHAAMGHCTPPAASSPAQPATSGCTPEHAAMGHCGLPAPATRATTPSCPPEHAAMGHCTPAGNAPSEPLTPIPVPSDADRAAAFPEIGHHAMEHAPSVHSMVLFDRLEAWDAEHGTGQAWEASAWIGGDIHRLWLRSEGERDGGRTGASDLEVLYGRSVTPWWDVVVGARQAFRPGARSWAAFGVQGLAPHLFEVSATAYVGSGGQVQASIEAEYELLLTNRLILQPLVEATASLKDEPDEQTGSGLNKVETGLRLRYEFSRRFAPYVGVVHERSFGRTARYLEAAGGHARDTRVVAGVRIWF